jgi:Photosynthetic reaction centre cytochrome C subunit
LKSLPAAALAVLAVAFAANAIAQTPAPGQSAAPEHEHEHPMPAPTNLKVLPKNLTGEQVHQIMHGWEAALGTECSTCHAADPKNIGPNGKPRLNFADDSKPDKTKARLMAKMVDDINKNYVSKLEDSEPVTCGTCHRGHLEPPKFTPPPDHDHHEHGAPAPAGTTPPGQ